MNNINLNHLNNKNNQSLPKLPLNNSNSNLSNIDVTGVAILFAMGLKVCGLIPLVVKVARNKSAEDISYVTPIMFLIAFVILATISFVRQFYIPLLLFLVGITVSGILLIQKHMYENSKYNNEINDISQEVDDLKTKFKFPNPFPPKKSN